MEDGGMIALGLLVLAGAYIAALIFAGCYFRSRAGRVIALSIVLAPLIWKTWDIPIGHYRFKQACKAEAGIKVYDPDPLLAKRLRFEGSEFGRITSEYVLKRYPSLLQIEAKDREIDYARPIAYGLYERRSDGSISSSLMDKVGQPKEGGNMTVLESAPSQADYAIKQSREYLPFRLQKNQFSLRSRDGRLVATVTSFGYTDTDAGHSLLGMPWGRAEGCGPGSGQKDILIDLITPKK